MAYSRHPWYIFGTDKQLQIYKVGERLPQCNVEFEGMGQFILNLLERPERFLAYIQLGLEADKERFEHYCESYSDEEPSRTMKDVKKCLKKIYKKL